MVEIKNIVTIDPSINCTAITCNGNSFVFSKKEICLTKSGKFNKWFKISYDNGIGVYETDLSHKNEKIYSKLELAKYHTYNSIVEEISKAIDKLIIPGYTLFIVEGYSYSSAAGPIIDLVTFGTLLRQKLQSLGSLVILSPSTIKRESAKLVYPPIKKGSKVEYRNKDGVAGGSFSKHDILKVLIDYDNIKNNWLDFLRLSQDEILEKKDIPKPIEDVNDSLVCYFILDKICREEKYCLEKVLKRLELKNI